MDCLASQQTDGQTNGCHTARRTFCNASLQPILSIQRAYTCQVKKITFFCFIFQITSGSNTKSQSMTKMLCLLCTVLDYDKRFMGMSIPSLWLLDAMYLFDYKKLCRPVNQLYSYSLNVGIQCHNIETLVGAYINIQKHTHNSITVNIFPK